MFDLIIIGAGSAGASAALMAAKAKKQVLVLDTQKSLATRAWVENHYGVLETTGPDLLEIGLQQVKKFGATVKNEQVVMVEKQENKLIVTTETASYEAKHVILATGLVTELAEKIGLEMVPGTEPRVKSIVKVDSCGRTSISGIWAAGAIAGESLHTIITAGHGAKVAIEIISELNSERYVDHDVLKVK